MAAVAEWWTQHLSSPQHGHIWLADVLGHQQMGGDGLPFPPRSVSHFHTKLFTLREPCSHTLLPITQSFFAFRCKSHA